MSNVLNLLIEQARKKADELAKAQAETRQRIATGQEKLDMLDHYKGDCQSKLHSQAAQSSVSMALWGNQQAFVGKIDHALQQQRQELVFLEQTLQQQQQNYQACLAQQRKFEALLDREAKKQAHREAKRDQKMNDEFAARIHRVNTAGETQ